MNTLYASGHTAVPLKESEQLDQSENFLGFSDGLVRMQPGNWLLPTSFLPLLNKIYHFPFEPSDVLIMTWQKCGTTWMQEMAWTMLNNPNLNNPMANEGVNIRSPFLELDGFMNLPTARANVSSNILSKESSKQKYYLKDVESISKPRTMKTHLPLSLLNPNMLDSLKIIYLARNPKDVVLSFLHSCCIMKLYSYVGTQEKFVDYFVQDSLNYGSYAKHLKEAYALKNHKNMHFVFYENMISDPIDAARNLNKFLETSLTEEQIVNIAQYTSFDSMKNRDNFFGELNNSIMVEEQIEKRGAGFFRRGKVGSWKETLTNSEVAKIEKWTTENLSEISFKYS